MDMRRSLGAVVLAAAVVTMGEPAAATTLVPADLGELSRDADVIARGLVVAVDSRVTDDRRVIETLVTLETDGYVKGDMGRTLRFLIPGGQVGRYRRVVIGAPNFSVGQRVIVFLGGRAPALPFVLGLSQGVFHVVPAAAGYVVVPPAVVAAGVTQPIVRGDLRRRPLPLDQFESEVRALAGAAR
jgi:hypothetical protein